MTPGVDRAPRSNHARPKNNTGRVDFECERCVTGRPGGRIPRPCQSARVPRPPIPRLPSGTAGCSPSSATRWRARRTPMCAATPSKFYEWLGQRATGICPHGPPIWICGDCHLGNLGPVADAKGRVADPDPRPRPDRDRQSGARPHPPRPVAGHGGARLGPARRHHRRIARAADGRLRGALAGDERRATKTPRPSPSGRVLEARGAPALATPGRGAHRQRRAARCRSASVLAADARGARGDRRAVRHEIVRRLVTSLQSRDDDAPVEVVDAAYWMKGCSSLGRLRYAVMLRRRARPTSDGRASA